MNSSSLPIEPTRQKGPADAHSAKVEATIRAALSLSAEKREVYLQSEGAEDQALAIEVRALLAAQEASGALESNTPEVAAQLARLKPEAAGDWIGNYKLLQELGEGGFGTVWMAEQEQPVRRRVALKIIKLGMDTKEVIARFEQERQAMAMMDHLNIAKVFDAGATQWGRPFFVMEAVKGVPITQFCDEQHISTRERLALFGDVCSAINHAHQKGIIHRDIKPSNVLVTLDGNKPVVKVIDFGIAKALLGKLTDKTLFTRFEQFIGTPVYMSPEQAALSAMDIDTRSDIYALGVLLYELLTGKPPFDAEALLSVGYDEMRRIIREVEPPKPSLRLSTMASDERNALAKARHIAPDKIGRLVEPDLDWIVMKAIEKDRARRYETANGFAVDVQRHLNNEAVMARPPTNGYRLRKFVRRHKVGFLASTTVVIVLLAATGFSWWQVVRAKRAEREQRELRQRAEHLNAQLLRVRADVSGRRGEWKQAESDLRDVLKLDDSDPWDWLRFATLLVHNGEHAEYKSIRPQMLARYRKTKQAEVADRIAKAALLLPGDAEELVAARDLANKALKLGSKTADRFLPYYRLTASLAAYRTGQIPEARQLVEKALTAPSLDINIQGLAHVQLGMIERSDGEVEKAKIHLREADEILQGPVKVTTGTLEQNYWQDWWHDWLVVQILRAEAQAVIQ
jgi:serine/threonine protein kinase